MSTINCCKHLDRGRLHVAYVLKRYPRFSETFIVNEILAHERAGTRISIFALRPPADAHFQPAIARVRAPVTFLHSAGVRVDDLWKLIKPRLSDDRLQGLADTACCEGIDVFQALQLAQSLRNCGADHIHAHFATSAADVARMTSKLTGIPYSFTAHAKDIYHEYVDPLALGQKLADASRVVTVSDYNKQYLSERFPECSDKVFRVYNGLPLEDFPFSPWGDRSPYILAIGRLVEKKGFSDLVAACSMLAHQNVQFHCNIIGGGDQESQLRRQIVSLGLESYVRLLGPQSSDCVKVALKRAAVLAVPCITASTGDRDGLPTVLLEAMALGTPCVATTVTGIPEVVQHEETGLLIPERNPEQLATALRRLIADGELARNLASRARQVIEANFDIDRNAAELRELFARSEVKCARGPQLAEAV